MKKWTCALLMTAVLLVLGVCTAALADQVPGNIPGEQVEVGGITYTMLMGDSVRSTEQDMKFVQVMVMRNSSDIAAYFLVTDTETLMDAIVDTGVGKVEKTSWGYSVVSMDEIDANYSVDGSWWGIMRFDGSEFVQLETGVENTPIQTNDAFLFIYQR